MYTVLNSTAVALIYEGKIQDPTQRVKTLKYIAYVLKIITLQIFYLIPFTFH